MTCVENLSDCPITSLAMWMDADNVLEVVVDKKAINLPVLRVLLREGFPCLRTGYTPGKEDALYRDELRRGMTPCPRHPFFETRYDTRYDYVPGNLFIDRTKFEKENGLLDIWADRYSDGLPEDNLIREMRKEGRLRPYQRGTIGWSLECELDETKPSRSEVFEQILSREIRS